MKFKDFMTAACAAVLAKDWQFFDGMDAETMEGFGRFFNRYARFSDGFPSGTEREVRKMFLDKGLIRE